MQLIISPNRLKKFRAIFSDGKHKDFGSRGSLDYTISHDKEQRRRYLARHKKNENWNNPRSAGALSRHLLWGESTSLQQNLRDFKLRFAGQL